MRRVLREFRSCTLNIFCFHFLLADKLDFIVSHFLSVPFPDIGCLEIGCKFFCRAGLAGDARSRNASVGIGHSDEEVGRSLTICWFIPENVLNFAMSG